MIYYGWTIERADKKPFNYIKVKAPNGAICHACSIGAYPENILYQLAETILKEDQMLQRTQME